MQSSEDVNPELSNLSVNSNKSKLTASATTSMERKVNRSFKINWFYSIGLAVTHLFGIVGIVNVLQGRILASTIIFGLVLAELGCLGVTIGAHRLWSHRAFKANLPLRILLVACQTLSGQDSVWMWVIWHRVHHKYVDTDNDPHNSTRGFFFSHVGWLMTYDHQKFRPLGLNVDMSDILKDPVVMWQKKYIRKPVGVLAVLVMPTIVPWLCFNESFVNAFCVAACLKTAYVMNRVFLINSAAHMWGYRPYDKNLFPAENKFVSFAVCGEGWHNYHHSFPHDYKAAELGLYRWNLAAAVIDFFGWIGWAYDLRTASQSAIRARVERTGDKVLYESRTFG